MEAPRRREGHKGREVLGRHEKAQIITYLKLRDCRLGFLLNWNVELMKQGIIRFIHNYTPPDREGYQVRTRATRGPLS
jgi:hypothetical protein